MPLQNRVTPFGELIATPARGMLMGNRGCLHDASRRLRRSFAVKRWIVCRLEFRGRRRTVMAPGHYTELFFLDEATALAAGHRPCAECQRDRYEMFRACWAGREGPAPSADDLDAVLHAERLDAHGRKRTFRERFTRLPPGVMIADRHGHAYLVEASTLRRWVPHGYAAPVPRPTEGVAVVLTPRSTVRAVRRGYPVAAHPALAST